jgi:hypothetical protein
MMPSLTPALAQVVGELDAAGAGAVVGDPAFGEAAVRQPVFRLEGIEQGGDVVAGESCVFQLAGEFGPAVLAPRQQAQGALAQVARVRRRLHFR